MNFNPIPIVGRQYHWHHSLPEKGFPAEYELVSVIKVTDTQVEAVFEADGGIGYYTKSSWNYHAREAT